MESHEYAIRFSLFAGVLAAMALWEFLAPRRRLTLARPRRWGSNLALVALNTLVVRLVAPLGAMGVAEVAAAHGWGLLNVLRPPEWVAVPLAVILLDFAIYLQHVLFHAIPLLWRLHRVHHADLDFDTTTGLRFHTLEILISLGLKAGAILLLGASPLAVLLFEVVLNATSMFNHGNVRLPGWLDRILRLVVVTPDMHRVHHSVIPDETNSNFGFNLPWWDYLLGTYRSQPVEGHEAMTIGLNQYRDQRVEQLPWMLLMPFVDPAGNPLVKRSQRKSHSG